MIAAQPLPVPSPVSEWQKRAAAMRMPLWVTLYLTDTERSNLEALSASGRCSANQAVSAMVRMGLEECFAG